MSHISDTKDQIVKFLNRVKVGPITLFPITDTPNPGEFDAKSTGVSSFFQKRLNKNDTYRYFYSAYIALVEIVEKLMQENQYRGLKVAEAIIEQKIRSWPELYVNQVIKSIKSTYGENIGNVGISKSTHPPSDLWMNAQFAANLRIINAAYYDACEVVNKNQRSATAHESPKELSDYVSTKTLLITNALKELSKYSISFENVWFKPSEVIPGEITISVGFSCAHLSIPVYESPRESVEENGESAEKKEVPSKPDSSHIKANIILNRCFITPEREVGYDSGFPFKLYISPLTFGITCISQEIPNY